MEPIKGKITVIKPVQKGDNWEKIEFVIANNDGYQGQEQLFCFEVFGADKVAEFEKYNKVGREVEVSFNIRCREWEGKHFTNLQAWKVFGVKAQEEAPQPQGGNDLPF